MRAIWGLETSPTQYFTIASTKNNQWVIGLGLYERLIGGTDTLSDLVHQLNRL